MADQLTHLDDTGQAKMVDVSAKQITDRVARVGGEIRMQPATVEAINNNQVAKGNVLTTARIAGIQAAKRTAELIPLCHPLNPTSIEIDLVVLEDRVRVEAQVRLADRTGVEMEALTAASVALLTIYDMCKGIDRGMVIGELRLLEKDGGRSGRWVAD
ncbi:MAG: cyclic pyranopterin monophosphate synthase MoaC [Candidatus Latescibacterota bacterium]|jgi:cyclic pyranopterin phosphate synthase|nr:cyclic pyranopterin monophosphate synthase MoaC [Gemmatimonadota bacterium]MDP6982849.1 cyclic pyranopterin monophosphate synthase MoaC [Candidatus Latescibacterota bacterium]MBU10308.1 cyclic pyranopterin monophosphate synthase MoaC [Gemmatimonadota bacterium]MDP7635633.1 cyclic pyranopterin monophosphate synthase MoaC [Candidatus Latescibacterota bacterium]MEC9378141.1 cyclic pyranopterin monophosphate synthase MoaC [Candidatus Latescibacterota bacterium]|tara:strand:- start:878 stop:1351 length:474 start_codon:yes stop_codon:yes gene_type:complete